MRRILYKIKQASQAYWQTCLSIDIRSLALFRLGLGALILCDALNRLPHARAFLSDIGTLSRADVLQSWRERQIFSLYFINGSEFFAYILLAITAAVACLLMVGFRTKLMTILAWFLVVSLQLRNPLILQGGDDLLKLLLFWSVFLPLGQAYSIDSLSKLNAQKTKTIHGIASIALLAQVIMLYTFAGLLKSGGDWQTTGDAIYYALHIDHFTTPFGIWLRNFDGFLRFLTFATVKIEVFAPFLFITPFLNPGFRMLGITVFASLHIGFILSMRLGLFPYIDLVALIPFIPSLFWDKFSKKFKDYSFKLSSSIACTLESVENLLPTNKGFLAKQRTTHAPNTAIKIFIASCLAIALLSNVEKHNKKFEMPVFARQVGDWLHLNQHWAMFSPNPMKHSGWFILQGKTQDGKEVDPFRKVEIQKNFSKPALVSNLYPNQRWRKYFMNLQLHKFKTFRLHFGQYLCRENNRARVDPFKKLIEFKLIYMEEKTQPPGGKKFQRKRKTLWKHNCFKKRDPS